MAKVGIDLGTTHTVVASLEEQSSRGRSSGRGASAVQRAVVFPMAQLTAPHEISARPLLPSCLYAPLPSEGIDAAAFTFTDPPFVSGELARRRGAEVPGRLVASAKSWLCHAGVDRTAAILPWGTHAEGDDAVPMISPVDATTQILLHVRRAWDSAHPDAPLAEAEVVLTVPASFDEAARALTLEATVRAGLSVHLLEEPQAAFYDFLSQGGDGALRALLGDRSTCTVLVCDVGGGTTDLSLLRVTKRGLKVDRVAVGDHLLLGGDNMDLALAHFVEKRFPGGAALSPARFGQLVVACRAQKERLLSADAPGEVTITLAGEGSKLIGGSLRATVTRDEITTLLLDGFFPIVPPDATPARARGALLSLGLPYARDTAITRHLAQFLAASGVEKPDAVLFNGGVFHAEKARARVVAAMSALGGGAPVVLPHADPDLAVARGAALFVDARRGVGRRIGGGSARAYFVGVGDQAMCLLPQGAAPGVKHRSEKELVLLVGRAARFDLFAAAGPSTSRPGELVPIDEETLHRLPPVATTLSAGGASELPVVLEGELSEVGTLDLACVEIGGDRRRFALAFQLRSGTRPSLVPPPASARGKRIDEAQLLVSRVFAKTKEAVPERAVKDLVRDLERALGERASWSGDLARSLFDALIPLARGRRRSIDHERVFLSLAGYTLRPGFGHPDDATRIALVAPLFTEPLTHTRELRVWQQLFIAARRCAGGLDEDTQIALHDAHASLWSPETRRAKSKGAPREAEDDALAMLALFERVPARRKVELGEWLVERTWTRKDPRLWDAIGRIGARVPAYGSAHVTVPVRTAEAWIDELLRAQWNEVPTAPMAGFRLARLTGDRARDVSDRHRREVVKRLEATAPELARGVAEIVEDNARIAEDRFGDSLPPGLRLG